MEPPGGPFRCFSGAEARRNHHLKNAELRELESPHPGTKMVRVSHPGALQLFHSEDAGPNSSPRGVRAASAPAFGSPPHQRFAVDGGAQTSGTEIASRA